MSVWLSCSLLLARWCNRCGVRAYWGHGACANSKCSLYKEGAGKGWHHHRKKKNKGWKRDAPVP